ncbi:hypothetical protein FQZ97_959690 [compost metagenome]
MWFSWRRMERRRASTSLGVEVTSRPSTVTVPLSMAMRRLTMERSVDLPAPLGPMIEVMPPLGRLSVTPSTTQLSP